MIAQPTRQLWLAQAYSQGSRHITLWIVELLRAELVSAHHECCSTQYFSSSVALICEKANESVHAVELN
jgi:hypothetical protein